MNISTEDRFFSKVRKTDGCWEWMASKNQDGYGYFSVEPYTERGTHMRGAHRVSWELANGPIPEGLQVLHRCDNPGCVRPGMDDNGEEHLFLGTQPENIQDMIDKGRSPNKAGENNGFSKLTEKDVIAIRSMSGTQKEIAKLFGVGDTNISEILRNKTWKHVA